MKYLDLMIRVGYRPHRGVYPIAVFHGGSTSRPPAVVYPEPRWVVKRREVRAEAANNGPRHLAPVETNVLHQFPNIVAHCSVTRYDDETPRKPGWLLLKTVGASWCVFVKDPDGACVMNLTASTLDDVLSLADLMLGADDAPWERDEHAQAQGKGKKK